jgi:hypothetical protein
METTLNGEVQKYAGPTGEERKVQTSFPDGQVQAYAGCLRGLTENPEPEKGMTDSTTSLEGMDRCEAIVHSLAGFEFPWLMDEVSRLVEYVECNFGVTRGDGMQFDSVFACAVTVVAKTIKEYGSGYSEMRGRTPVEYWLDEIDLQCVASNVARNAGFPSRVVVDVSPTPTSSARKCAGACGTKFEPGELRVVVSTPEIRPVRCNAWNGPAAKCKTTAFCLNADCIAKMLQCRPGLPHPYHRPIALSDATPVGFGGDRRISDAAWDVASKRLAELACADPPVAKPSARFPGDRKLSKRHEFEANNKEHTQFTLPADCPAARALRNGSWGEKRLKTSDCAQ